MFFQHPHLLPVELILNILSRLPLKDAIAVMRTCSELRDMSKDDSLWVKFGAMNFEDFVTRVNKLPKHYQQLMLNSDYSLTDAENMISGTRICKLPPDQRLEALLQAHIITQEKIDVFMPDTHIFLLTNKCCVMALCERLFTPEEFAALPDPDWIAVLFSVNGLQALREKLITPAQIACLPDVEYLSALLSDHGIIALRNRLITYENAIAMPHRYLHRLLSANGVTALSEKLITCEQAAAMPSYRHLSYLFINRRNTAPMGLLALREKLISPEDVAMMPDDKLFFEILLSENGLNALRDRLITPQQAANMPTHQHLKYLLSRTGAEALRAGCITPEQVAEIQDPEQAHQFILSKNDEIFRKKGSPRK